MLLLVENVLMLRVEGVEGSDAAEDCVLLPAGFLGEVRGEVRGAED